MCWEQVGERWKNAGKAFRLEGVSNGIAQHLVIWTETSGDICTMFCVLGFRLSFKKMEGFAGFV